MLVRLFACETPSDPAKFHSRTGAIALDHARAWLDHGPAPAFPAFAHEGGDTCLALARYHSAVLPQ